MVYHQIDCFKIHMTILRIIGIWPRENPSRFYVYYSKTFIFLVVMVFLVLYTINFYYLPRELDIIVEEMIFYFMDVTVLSKVLAFAYKRHKIKEMFLMLESDSFQSDSPEEAKIIEKAKKDTVLYWKITAAISIVANIANVYMPFILHMMLPIELEFPVCRYSFITEEYRKILMYPVYFYQSVCISAHMWYNVNLDTFLLGVILLAMAQLDILDLRLRRITNVCTSLNQKRNLINNSEREENAFLKLNNCIRHYEKICR